jgi:hypothetical protein
MITLAAATFVPSLTVGLLEHSRCVSPLANCPHGGGIDIGLSFRYRFGGLGGVVADLGRSRASEERGGQEVSKRYIGCRPIGQQEGVLPTDRSARGVLLTYLPGKVRQVSKRGLADRSVSKGGSC